MKAAIAISWVTVAAFIFGLITYWESPPATTGQAVPDKAALGKAVEQRTRYYTPSEVGKDAQRCAISRRPSTSGERAEALKLISRGDAASQRELARVHRSAGRDVRHLIEQHAIEKDGDLKQRLAAQAAAALEEKCPESKIAALETLHHLAAPEAAERVQPLVTGEEMPEVAEKAIAYLGRVNCHEAFDRVFAVARNSGNPRLKSTAIRNLVLIGGGKHPEKVIKLLAHALDDPSPRIQAEALRILPRFSAGVTPEMRKHVEELAKTGSEKHQVRDSACMVIEQWRLMAASRPEKESR